MMKSIAALILVFFSKAHAQFEQDNLRAVKDLKSVTNTFIKKDGTSKKTIEIIRKVETDAGRMEVALTKVNFFKSADSFKLIEAYSVTNNVKSAVDSKRIVTRNADVAKFGISDLMEVIIPFDNVNVGSEIHLSYELSSQLKSERYFSEMFAVTNTTLAKEEAYYYTSEVPLKVETIEFHPYYAVFPLKVDKGLYGYGIKPLQPAYHTEGVDIQSATFAIATAPSWEDVRKVEAPRFEQELKKALPKKYEQIVQSAKKFSDPKSIIDHVAAELAKTITYAGDWQTERGKLVPQPMATAAAKGRGDCKDYTTAMVAILRRLDFTAYPFLTFRSKSYEGPEKLKALAKIPMPRIFNHVIAHVKDKSGKSWWVDPTNPYVQADIITADILGNFGLLLDESSKDVSFLPDTNTQPANLTLMRSVVIEADNSINGKAVMTLTPSSHNTFGMVERMYGQAGVTKTLAMLLNPGLKSTKVDIKKTDVKDHKYEFDFVANDWVVDQKKVKFLVLINPFAFLADRLEQKKDIDIGEPGITKIITRIKKQKVEDTVAAGCLVRSVWFNFDRIVENTPDALVVTDELTVKKRFIAKAEADGKEYDSLLGDVSECVHEGSTLYIHMDPSLKSPSDIAEDKKNGPLLEAMTDKDAEDLYKMPRIDKTNYLRTKLVRYYQNQLKKKPTPQLYQRIGNSIIHMGYISADIFGTGYLEDGLEYYTKALSLATGVECYEILAEAIDHKINARKMTEAVVNFNEYYKANPKNFKSFALASKIASVHYKNAEAESWLKSGEKYAQTKDEKISLYKSYLDLFWDQKRHKEAIPYQEKVLALVPNAWNYNNLAALHLEVQNYDKVIELETKALSLMEFGMAKYVMSKAYVAKFIMNASNLTRSPASNEEAVGFLQQAIKYDPRNTDALSSMAMYQAKEYLTKKDKSLLIKGKSYLDQAMQVDPTHFKARKAMEIFKNIEDGKQPTEMQVTMYMVTKMMD